MGIFEARGCQEKKHLPAPLGDAGVVTYIQPPLIPHHILRGVIGLVALARRTFPRRCQPHLLVRKRQSKHKLDERGILLITNAERPRQLG
jgi:hypothetical protein